MDKINICLKCIKYNLSCLYGQDTNAVGCSEFVERTGKSFKIATHMIPVSIDSIRANLVNGQRAVVLKERAAEQYLPIWMGSYEADSIAVKLQRASVPRPLTHDFVCTLVRALGGAVKYVMISDLKNDTFYAITVIGSGDKQIEEIDCRPSDALAVAITAGVPIFVHSNVMNKVGILLDRETGKPTEVPSEKTTISGEKADKRSLEIFSELAQDVLSLAEAEAKLIGQSSVSTGHILAALLKKSPTTASDVLVMLGVDWTKLQVEVVSHINEQSNIEPNDGGLSLAVKKAIELSIVEAKRLGSEKVQPEHILLGLVRQNDGIAANLLRNLQINPERIYVSLIWLYTQPNYRLQSSSV